jgi:hypothetical protein
LRIHAWPIRHVAEQFIIPGTQSDPSFGFSSEGPPLLGNWTICFPFIDLRKSDMAPDEGVISLGVVAIIFAIVLLAHVVRMLVIPDFETQLLSVSEFVSRYNANARAFIFIDIFLFVLCIIPPVQSFILTLEVIPFVAFDFYQWWERKIDLDIIVAVRSLRSIKLIGILKMFGLFLGVCTCIVKIFIEGFNSQ